MTIRIIARLDDANMVANVGGSVLTQMKTFDIECPALEEFLTKTGALTHCQVVGVEVLPPSELETKHD